MDKPGNLFLYASAIPQGFSIVENYTFAILLELNQKEAQRKVELYQKLKGNVYLLEAQKKDPKIISDIREYNEIRGIEVRCLVPVGKLYQGQVHTRKSLKDLGCIAIGDNEIDVELLKREKELMKREKGLLS